MNYKERKDFIEDYDAFMKIKTLLYGAETYSLIEVGDEYENLVYELLDYAESMNQSEEVYINTEYPHYGGLTNMKVELYEQLDIISSEREDGLYDEPY